ncbi:MAG TPA: TIGR02302 family protein [Alphaproteobacteria bacterium]
MTNERNASEGNAPGPAPAAEDLRGLHLDRKLALARLALLWERLWPALWPAVGLGGVFIALALFDVLPYLPAWVHGAVLAAFVAAIAYASWQAAKALALPGRARARRRIEHASGLAHRPLSMLRDALATGGNDPETRALWKLHRLRTIARIRGLRVGLPAPGLARRDPWALRGALLVVLAIAVTIAWGDGLNRIARALAPGVGGAVKGPAVVDLWITPPAYTGVAPIFLSAGKDDGGGPGNLNLVAAGAPSPGTRAPSGGPIAIPEGSTVLVQLSGGWGTPRLAIGGENSEFSPVAEGTYKATVTVGLDDEADRLAIRQGIGEVASWPIRIVPDRGPTVRFAEEPGQSGRGAVRIEVEGEDDYGLAEARLFLRRARVNVGGDSADADAEAALERFNAPHTLNLPLPGRGAKAVKETSYHDLTAHPWAGMEVFLQIVARDGAGQPGVSDPVAITLPERYFRHPVARSLVLLRKRLMFDPESREDVVDDLVNLSTIPGSFNHDTVAYLAIRTAAHRLGSVPGLAVLGEVQNLLWDTALRLEDGALSLAERRLREIQKQLMEALNKNAGNAEIQKLMRELEQAMAEFLREMMKGLENLPQTAQPLDPNMQYLSPQDLQRLLDRARELAMTGNLDAARQMLSMLRELLENLRSGRFAMNQGRQGDSKAWDMLRELQEMMKRQQELMDETFRQSQEGMRDGQPPTGEGADRQGDLRQQLQDMLRRFGEMLGQFPRSLGDAELAMREALEALRKGQPGDAVGPQGRALEEMQRGAGEMLQQLMRQYGQGRGRGPGRGRAQQGRMPMTHDPLGRPLPNAGTSASDDVEIPDESETQRAREILEELRRRAGELGRPPIEMDYIERLLRRF